ncbi:MAG: asparagine synthase (glutamine-hydrolyzing) [Clostridiales bacterium]|nr:asparagine synthase (glutamine-hydrolyzing) [Clostridiales bacterium]
MCGFCGFTGQLMNREELLKEMTKRITHRGPDSTGVYMDDDIAMGFRRLSIIDLEAGHQPLYNEDKSLVLMFNGEIYNYRSLRAELLEKGHVFATETDSEVLLHGYEEWGEELLPRLRGMFAFVIWDTRDRSLFIARDPFGIKPMHYTLLPDGRLIYASEIKCILAHPDFVREFNEAALDSYLSFQYSLPKETFFKNVYCLPPAHFLRYREGEVSEQRYWESTFAPEEDMTLEEAVDGIDRAFTDSVEAHRISDVEVGCFLSGGVDSSYVASYFGGQKAFTVGFDNGQHYNECNYAAELAEHVGIEHYTHLISEEEYWQSLPDVQYHLDQPLADPACVALYFVSKLAAEHVKVVLSGEGADELFGGYRIYHEPTSLAGYQKLPRWLRKAAAAVVSALPFDFKGKSFLIRGSRTLPERFIGNAYMFNQKEKARLLKDIPATDPAAQTAAWYERCEGQDDVTRMQYLDINRWMVGDILLKADRMSMAHSLELRVPFLDREVFGVARRIPAKHRIAGGTTKYAMRLAAERHMPRESTARPKLGFPVPVRIWLRQEPYYNRVKAAFQSEAARRYFNTGELMKFLDQHYAGQKDNSRKIWTVYMFLTWYEVYFGENARV